MRKYDYYYYYYFYQIITSGFTVEVDAEVAELAANGAGAGVFVPDLIVTPVLVPQQHLRPWTFASTRHVQCQSRLLADDQEVLAFDPHRFRRRNTLDADGATQNSANRLQTGRTERVCLHLRAGRLYSATPRGRLKWEITW